MLEVGTSNCHNSALYEIELVHGVLGLCHVKEPTSYNDIRMPPLAPTCSSSGYVCVGARAPPPPSRAAPVHMFGGGAPPPHNALWLALGG